MPSRKSDLLFASIIDAVQRDDDDDRRAPCALRMPWFAVVIQGCVPEAAQRANTGTPARHYQSEAAFESRQADAISIARELGVGPGSSRLDVREARRRFALRNHPDRVPEKIRKLATARMAIANEILDALLKDK